MAEPIKDECAKIFHSLTAERRETSFHLDLPVLKTHMMKAGFSGDMANAQMFVNAMRKHSEQEGIKFSDAINDLFGALRKMEIDPDYKAKMRHIFENGLTPSDAPSAIIG